MIARVAIHDPGRIARSTLTDRACYATGIVSVITEDHRHRGQRHLPAGDRFWPLPGRPGRSPRGMSRSTVPGLRGSVVADDNLRAVTAGHDHGRGGAQRTVRRPPAVPDQAVPSR